MRERDRGTLSAFVVCLASTFLVVAGLAVDSGRTVATRIEAADHAENAARVGVQQVIGLRSGERIIDPVSARQAVFGYLARFDVSGDVHVEERSVTVTVRIIEKMTLLRLVGIGSRAVSATRRAGLTDG